MVCSASPTSVSRAPEPRARRLRCAALALGLIPAALGAAALPSLVDLSLGAEDARVLGDQAQSRGARAVALGDFNGDRFADMAIGVPEANRDALTLSDAGEVHVILGESPLPATLDLSAVSSPRDMLVLGHESFAELGQTLAAGDFNGDGFDDLAIGSPLADPESRTGAGEILLVFGADTLPTQVDTDLGHEDVRVLGAEFADATGSALATGDVNADGFDDLIIAAPRADRSQTGTNDQAGEVWVIFGAATWPAQIDLSTVTGVVVIRGEALGGLLGIDVAAGDIDGDGYDDIVAGVPNADGEDPFRNEPGQVVVVRGGDALPTLPTVIDLASAGDLRLQGDDITDHAGTAVATGDFNADGRLDLLIGAPDADQAGFSDDDAGEGYVWLGRATLPTSVDLAAGEEDVRILGDDGSDHAGVPLRTGDLDGDGRDDALIGIVDSDPGTPSTRFGAGEAVVLLGATLTATTPAVFDLELDQRDIAIHGDDSSDVWSTGLGAGDIDRDGFEDALVGAPEADPDSGGDQRFQAGEAAVILGDSTAATATRSRFDRAGDAPLGDLGPVLRVEIDHAAGTGSGVDGASVTTATLTRTAPTGAGLPAGVAAVQWEITGDRAGWTTADLSLCVTDAEITGLSEPLLSIYHAAAVTGPWSLLGTTVEETPNCLTAPITAHGFFAIGETKLSELVIAYLLGLISTPPPGGDVNGGGIDISDAVTLLLTGL